MISVGEVMIELARGSRWPLRQGCGGDTFNTAVYLARAGIESPSRPRSATTAIPTASWRWPRRKGIGGDLILRVPGRLPGLYLVDTDERGQRSFHYWRDAAPARELFELPDWGRIAEGLMKARLIYFSGITLVALFQHRPRPLPGGAGNGAQQGVKIAFDGNFRPHGWKGDFARTRAVFIEALKRVDIALPSYDDEAVLWGDPSPEATVERLQAFGIGEIVVKNGPHSALVIARRQKRIRAGCRGGRAG